jgi:hypothetical protein
MNIIIENKDFYEKNKTEFPFISICEEVITYAYDNLFDSNYDVEPTFIINPIIELDEDDFLYRNSYYAYINIKLFIDRHFYEKNLDDKPYIKQKLCELINKYTPDSIKNNIDIDIFSKTMLHAFPGEAWRENPVYNSTKGISVISNDDTVSIWGETQTLNIFLTHLSSDKNSASKLKNHLSNYGISAFVAHKDIKPSQAWQDTLEKALFSSDALIALVSDKFSESEWADHEVGIAIGRQIPVLPVKMTETVKLTGFIGKLQAFSRGQGVVKQFAIHFCRDKRTVRATLYSLLKGLEKANSLEQRKHVLDVLAEPQISEWLEDQKAHFSTLYQTQNTISELPEAKILIKRLEIDLSPSQLPSKAPWDDDIPF